MKRAGRKLLIPGQEIEVLGVKQNFLQTDRSGNLLARGEITGVKGNFSTALVVQLYSGDSTDFIYPGDLVSCMASPGYRNTLGVYQYLADMNIAFLDNYKLQPYHNRQLLFYPIKEQEQLLDSFYMFAVNEVAEMLVDDTTGTFGIRISNGLLKGKWLSQALRATTLNHVRTFIAFVKDYPGKYSGKRFKFSEVYATWLINSSPLSEQRLLELLAENQGKPFFNELLESYDSSIVAGGDWLRWKNSFIDSLDRGIFHEDQWEVIRFSANYYKDKYILAWLPVLEGSVLAFQSRRKEALAKLEQARQSFAANNWQEELRFLKNQVFKVNNERVAKVAVQTSHFLPYSISYSPNGKYFATYGDDYTIKIWDAKLVRQVTTINAHTSTVNSLRYSSNNRYFISASDDETIKIWDLGSLQLYKSIETGYRVKFATMNKFGDKIIAAGSDSCIRIYDFQTGKVDSTYRIHHSKINTGDYNPNYQNVFYSGGSDSMAYSTNIETGKWMRWYKSGGRVASVKATADRKYIAVLGDNGEIKVWKMGGKFQGSFNSLKFRSGSSKDATENLAGFDINSEKNLIAFVDPEKFLCIGSLDSMRYFRYNLKLENEIFEMAFHPSGNSLLLSTSRGKLYVVNIRQYLAQPGDNLQWHQVGSPSSMISSMGFSSDGRLFGFQSGGTYLLNLATGKTSSFGEESYGQMRGKINFTRNDSAIFFLPGDGKRIQEQNIYTGDTTYTISTDPDYVAFQNLSPDKKYLVSLFHKKAYVVYDRVTKEKLYTIPLDSLSHSELSGAMFIPGTNKLVINNDVDNSLSFYALDQAVAKPFARYTTSTQSPVYDMVYRKYGNEVIAGAQDNNLYFFDATTGKLKDTINLNYVDPEEGISILRLFDNEKKLFIGMNSRIGIFDLEKKKFISSFDDENIIASSAELSPAGDLLAVGTFTGVLSFYTTHDFKKVLEVQTFVDKDPVWVTPDNYYIASRSSLKELYFKYNNALYPFDQFDINFNRPDKVLEKLGQADPNLLTAYKEAWSKRFRKSGIPESRLRPDFKVPEVTILNADSIPEIITQRPVVKLNLAFDDADTTISGYNIWVNGIPQYGTNGKTIRQPKNSISLKDSVRLTGSVNVIQVSCKNSSGVESLKEKFEVRNYVKDTTARKTYLFIVSVSNYRDDRYDLRYARKDGRDIAQAFAKKYKENLVVDTLFDERATRQNILAWKKKMMQSRLKDRVIVYVSGHGLLNENFDFYYATQNVNFRKPSENGLAYEEIEKLLDSIPARQKLLLMDACHSGEVDKDDVIAANEATKKDDKAITVVYKSKGIGEEDDGRKKLGLNNSFELMQDLFANLNSGNGTVVISAAAGNSYAYESDEWKNGVFTYCILHGLKDGAADEDYDGNVTISELQKYVSTQVQKLTKGAQKPTARQENLENDWILW